MKKQAGFTLVELVVVIVVLGLLAATALPKFINVTDKARAASMNGVAGGLRSAASLARAQYVLDGSKTSTSILMDGSAVTVLDENTYSGRGGRPVATAAGIGIAMPTNTNDYTVTYAAGVATYQPVSGGSATCQVQYTEAAINDPVAVSVGGC